MAFRMASMRPAQGLPVHLRPVGRSPAAGAERDLLPRGGASGPGGPDVEAVAGQGIGDLFGGGKRGFRFGVWTKTSHVRSLK